MEKWFGSILALGFVVQASLAADPNDIPLAAAVESHARGGLPHFHDKLEAGKEVRIAYLGGSITAQEGWRPQTLAYFQKTFPKAKISQIPAAIGGTGSDLGVFRLKQDVLDHNPDLVFVEFAVNDGGTAPAQIYRCMEGIVRQIWKWKADCDIAFVYTFHENMAPTIQGGKYPRAASAMENIADHYGIPSIHMGIEACRLATQGKLVFKAKPKTDEEKKEIGDKIIFSGDGVHPNEKTGHVLYTEAIVRSLPAIWAAGKTAHERELRKPFVADNYERAKLIPMSEAKLSSEFAPLDPKHTLARRFAERMPAIYRANKAGATISFQFQGTRAAVFDVIGPDCGQVAVTLDGRPPVTKPLFDSYCTYHRLQTLAIGSELPEGIHTVKIELLAGQPDKAKILSQRNEKIDDPRKFDDIAIYAGALMIVGELVK